MPRNPALNPYEGGGGTGPEGPQGPPGQGVPTGGTTGQALVKASSTNFDTNWQTISGGGGSGNQYFPAGW